MFASTEPSGFPPAILSRLQRFDVRRLSLAEIEGKMRRILAADGRTAEDAAIRLIARLAAGGMRDAESMLDQLLSAAPERIDESHVRELLGLADAEVVSEFIDLLVRGDAAAGVALLDQLDERGRDVRALLDQVVEAIRLELVAGLATPGQGRHDPAALASVGRRIAAIDPNRAGIGGLRFQLELALFHAAGDGLATPTRSAQDATGPAARRLPARPAQAPGRAVVEPPASAGQDGSRGQPAPAAPTTPATRPAPTDQPATRRTPAPPPSADTPAASAATRPTEPAPRPAARPTEPATAAPPVGGASALDELLAAWPAIVAQLSAHPPTKPLVVACRPVTVDGAIVTLGFPEEQAFLKDAAERRRTAIEAGIGAVLGRPVTVRCVVANVEIAATEPADAAYVLAEARRIFADDIVDVGEVS
jgi:DNA polymerase-3 subunit gamma/tau